MARLEFYFNDTDRADLLEFIQANKGIVIPDKLYDSPGYKVIADYEELTGHLKNDISHYFLLNSEINAEPLVLSRNRFISEEKYYINQRKGGPYIDFSFYTGLAEDSVIPYRKSIIELYPKFIHFDSHQEFNVTVEVKEYYNLLISFIKERSKKITIQNKSYLLSYSVLNEVDLK